MAIAPMKDKEIAEVLAVLKLSKRQQREWCRLKIAQYNSANPLSPVCSPADLAFKMRDERVASDLKSETDSWWCEASYEVFLHIIGEENEKDEVGLDTWFSMYAQPIHWIAAALIAGILAKDSQ